MNTSDPPELDYKHLFQFLPERFMVIRTDDPTFTIVETNKVHAGMAMIQREEVIGKPFFEVFPDVSPKFKKTGVSDLRESFCRVIKTGEPDTMERFRYDIRQPDGAFVERHWRPTHFPLRDTKGRLSFIVQVSYDVTDEVYAERQQTKAQRHLEDALAIGKVGSWVWDIKTNTVVTDAMMARLFGIDPVRAAKGLPVKVLTKAVHPDDRERVEQDSYAAVRKKGTFESEYRTISADGIIRWVLARGRVETDEQGNAVTFPGVMVDITERKEAEERFKQQLAFTNAVTSQLGEGVYALNARGKLTYMNNAAEQMLGWREEELIGKSLHEVAHFQRLDGTRVPAKDCPFLETLKTGVIVRNHDEVFTRKDGSMFIASSTSAPIMKDGVITGMVQSFSDVTEQKQTAHNLNFLSQASKLLSTSLNYNKTLRQISTLVVPIIADWCAVDLFNPETGTLERISVAHKDPAKVAWAQKLQDKYGVDMNAPTGVPKVLRTGKPEFYPYISDEMLVAAAQDAEQLKILRKVHFTSVIIVPLNTNEGTIGAITFATAEQKRQYTHADLEMAEELASRVVMAMTNAKLYQTARNELKERMRLEQELLAANEKLEARVTERTAQLELSNQSLERSNRELQDFAYVASHDLQEPLRKIQAFGNLLESEYGAELGEGKDYLLRMRNAASRMSILIEDLLAFSRVTTKARPFVSVDLDQIADEVVGDLETRIEETHGTVKIGELPIITGDPVQMRQLLQNLIANALKFHRPDVPPVVKVDGKVITSSNGKIKSYQLSVSDNGIGFDEKYLDRIFSVFQRLHGHESYEGTGIGLAVCRKIVERHGGTITARSKIGKGSTFIITLPAKLPKEEHIND